MTYGSARKGLKSALTTACAVLLAGALLAAPLQAQDAAPSATAQEALRGSEAGTDHTANEAPEGAIGTTESTLTLEEAAAPLPHDLSPWGMFLQADVVVKGVMIGLVIASLITWTIWFAKRMEISAAKRRAKQAFATLA